MNPTNTIKKTVSENFDICFNFLFNESGIPIIIIDKDFNILSKSSGCDNLIGLNGEKNLFDLIVDKYPRQLIFPEKGESEKFRIPIFGKEKTVVEMIGKIINIGDLFILIFKKILESRNKVVEKISAMNDEMVDLSRELNKKNIELERTKKRIEKIMKTDPLTKLLNRRDLYTFLNEEIDKYKKFEYPFVLMMMDLDHFKEINDKYGHDKGDVVLQAFSNLIKKSIRKKDKAFRFGGEEFLVILAETDLESGRQIAERIRLNQKEYSNSEIPKIPTVSIGLTAFGNEKDSMKKVLKRVDDALYLAKNNGRNRIEVI